MQELIDALKSLDADNEVIAFNQGGREFMTDTDYFTALGEEAQAKVNRVLELCDNLLVNAGGYPNYTAWLEAVTFGQAQGYKFDVQTGEEDSCVLITPVTQIAFDCYC
jgi:hypothetical protein